MQPNDKAEFMKTLIGMAAIKPGKPLSPEGYELFWNAMQGWPLDEFKQAASHLARTCEFMPNPYHFEQLRKAGRPTAGEAFAKAVKHAASSAYRNGPHPDQMVERAVRAIGGWSVIAMSDEDKLHFLEKRFTEHYETIEDAEDVRESLPHIPRSHVNGPASFQRIAAAIPDEWRDS